GSREFHRLVFQEILHFSMAEYEHKYGRNRRTNYGNVERLFEHLGVLFAEHFPSTNPSNEECTCCKSSNQCVRELHPELFVCQNRLSACHLCLTVCHLIANRMLHKRIRR